MKILITAPSLDENRHVSGISTVVRQIIEHGNYDYTHFTAGRRDEEKQNAGWILRQPALPFQFFRQIKSENFDVVHLNTAFNPLSIIRDYALAKAAKLARRPIFLHIHGGKFLAREFENKRLEKIAVNMLKMADAIVVLSDLEKNIIETRWKNFRVQALENAVALGKAPGRQPVTSDKTIIFLGRMHESKGLNEIIEVVEILQRENIKFKFRAFGAGELQDYFVAEMWKLLGENFHFGGVISGKEKWQELSAADIFLLPSRYGEGLPMAMLEAMAAECLVVVSEMASIGAVVCDGANGFLVEPKNTAQLAGKLKRILLNEESVENLRRNARQTIEKHFNLRDYIARLEKIYVEISN